MLLVALARCAQRGGRDESRSFAEAVEQLLEQARLFDLDRDVVDAAAVVVGSLTLDQDLGRERLGAVRQQDVLVGRDHIEEGGDREQDTAGDDQELEEAGHELRIGAALGGLAGHCSLPGCDARSETADAGSPGSHSYRGD